MLKLMDLLTEGVNDKGNFKAVFMAGGPGSGKSFIAAQLFGIPETTSVSVSGLSVVNSDRQFKMLLKKYGFDPTMLDKYEKTDPFLFKHLYLSIFIINLMKLQSLFLEDMSYSQKN